MLSLRLLGGFRLARDGVPIEVPQSSAKVIAFLGLNRYPVLREEVAAALWPSAEHRRALGNLRTALWRLPERAQGGIRTVGRSISVDVKLTCDVHSLPADAVATCPSRIPPEPTGICAELLPGWYDDWILVERERLNLERAELFERLSAAHLDGSDFTRAILYAAASIWMEPFRESAHRALLRAHAAQGSYGQLFDHYEALVDLLDTGLGVEPSAETTAVVMSCRRQAGDAGHTTVPEWDL